MDETVKRFWMVYVEGGQGSTFKHDTIESAIKEANRLARFNDSNVYVLETVRCFHLRTVDQIPFEQQGINPSDLPF